jgi:hypothetical protein
MHRIQLRLIWSILVICGLAVIAQAQNPVIEYGDTSELKGIEKVYIDTKNDMDLHKVMGIYIHNKLPNLQIVSKPEEANIHLRFYFDTENNTSPDDLPYPRKTAVAIIEKVIDKDRVRVLMGYRGRNYPKRKIFMNYSNMGPEAIFADQFVKLYEEANIPTDKKSSKK